MMLWVDSASLVLRSAALNAVPAAPFAARRLAPSWAIARWGAWAGVPAPLVAGPEHAARRRPVPTEAAPAVRSVRSAGWRAGAPMARNERLMHFRRASAANGFACPE